MGMALGMGRRPLLAATIVALLGAGCGPAPEIRQGDQPMQPAPGATAVATTTPAAASRNSASDDDDTDCDVETTTASYLPQKVCTSASERKQDKDSARAFIESMKPR
jgi:hypothetical protein